jgi:hypothetical protein
MPEESLTSLSLPSRFAPNELNPASSKPLLNGANPLSSSAMSFGVFLCSSLASRSAPAATICLMHALDPFTAAQ